MEKTRTNSEAKEKPSRAQGCGSGSVMPLANGKHEHFAQLVARGESPAKAYVLCGYSPNGALQSGNRLLRKAGVSARIEELKRAVSERQIEKTALDRAWVVAMLVDNVKRAMQVEPVRDRDGKPSGQHTYQGGVANRALELLGKELGMFQQKDENSMDAQEMITLLSEGRRRVAEEKAEREASGDPTLLQ
jgi:phage terminase small subunit